MDCVYLPVNIYFPGEILAFIANDLKNKTKTKTPNQAPPNSLCIDYTALRFSPSV